MITGVWWDNPGFSKSWRLTFKGKPVGVLVSYDGGDGYGGWVFRYNAEFLPEVRVQGDFPADAMHAASAVVAANLIELSWGVLRATDA